MENGMQNVNVILYENFTALDVSGPVEALSGIEGYRIRFVSMDGGIIANRQGIRLETEPIGLALRTAYF